MIRKYKCATQRGFNSHSIAGNIISLLTTHHSRVHYLILMIDALHVHGIKILCDELFAQSQRFTLLNRSFQNLIPSIGLQNGDVIVLLVFADLF